ncbi:unnamed protein product [Darwinula stevensoni]|uniref:EGF-like domain-containing protein n=1 Tax=Darwinula stevensoni TaxID=69355 RepID=A0A7R8XMG8_9CRUS|nr:unnamed protein product [Darwinula stevensoni]CAG0895593.1 unnamed protein product [Darwinula stevensoni]
MTSGLGAIVLVLYIQTMKLPCEIGLFFFALIHRTVALVGEHVCTKLEPASIGVNVSYMYPYRHEREINGTIAWRNSVKVAYRTEVRRVYIQVEECCNGYEATKQNTCKLHCRIPCFHGECKQPDTCNCDPGWTGSYCGIPCPWDRWGPECRNHCTCLNRGVCDPVDGSCRCDTGWMGTSCQLPCPPDRWGYGCKNHCNCATTHTCDPSNGNCTCAADWTVRPTQHSSTLL